MMRPHRIVDSRGGRASDGERRDERENHYSKTSHLTSRGSLPPRVPRWRGNLPADMDEGKLDLRRDPSASGGSPLSRSCSSVLRMRWPRAAASGSSTRWTCPGSTSACAHSGSRRGCSSSSTGMPVTARRSRSGCEVPHLRLPLAASLARRSRRKVLSVPGWREVALWWEDERVLVCMEALGTVPYFRARDEPLGVHPFLRLYQPRALRDMARCLAPGHVLVGHGEGIHGEGAAAAALAQAVRGARRTTPRWLRDQLQRRRAMRDDLGPGNPFPDLRPAGHHGTRDGAERDRPRPAARARVRPRLVVPASEQARLRNVVGLR